MPSPEMMQEVSPKTLKHLYQITRGARMLKIFVFSYYDWRPLFILFMLSQVASTSSFAACSFVRF